MPHKKREVRKKRVQELTVLVECGSTREEDKEEGTGGQGSINTNGPIR